MIPFFLARGRYSKLVREFPTEAAKFREAAMKAMEEEAIKKYGEANSAAKSSWMSKQRSEIGKAEREIERAVPKTTAEYDAAVKRMETGRGTEDDVALVRARMLESSTPEQQGLFYKSPEQEALFQRTAARVKAAPKRATLDDKDLVKQVVIEQKTMLRKKAWAEFTKDWTDADKEDWERTVLSRLQPGVDPGYKTPVRGQLDARAVTKLRDADFEAKALALFDEYHPNPVSQAWGRFVRNWGSAKKRGLSAVEYDRLQMLDALDDLLHGNVRKQQTELMKLPDGTTVEVSKSGKMEFALQKRRGIVVAKDKLNNDLFDLMGNE